MSLRRVNTTSLEERIAELEAAVSARSDEWEPDGSEDQELHRPRRIIYTRPPTEEEKSGRKTTLRLSQIALIETGPANDDEEASPAAKPVPFRHDTVEEPEPTTSEDDAHVSALAEAVAQSVAEMAEDALQDDDAFNAALADAVKRSITEDAEENAPVEATEDDPVAEPEPEDHEEPQEPEAAAPPEPLASNDPVDEPENIAAPAVAPIAADRIDVEHLRPLVSALIREELQGELGERITRNVRKLVRREINRALSGREFE